MIELLAVIVILAVIALIATPIIMNVINDAKKGSAKDSGYSIIKAAELMVAKGEFELPVKYTENDELNYKGAKPTKMVLEIDGTGKTNLAAFIDGYCVVKGYSDSEVVIDDTKKTGDTCLSSMKHDIVVDVKDGLIPITFDKDNNTITADVNTSWYDYDTKKWANAVSVTSESRSKYLNTSNKAIDEIDILAYYVYIPRYRYQLWNAENGVSNPQEIKIEFERRSTPKSVGTTNLEWLTHPAFTFGSDELNGIWVGKFELTGSSAVPTIKPNSVSLTNQNMATAFKTIKSMQSDKYGLASYDTHMVKNVEWGAVAYLSHSKYGKGSEIWINNTQTATSSSMSITGCSGDSVSAGPVYSAKGCEANHRYNEAGGINASTTGNVTGIYDMSGGVFEFVMGIVVDKNGLLNYSKSGFTAATMPDKKYYDTYQETIDVYDFPKGKLGDATKEIIRIAKSASGGWYNDYTYIPTISQPWFYRGGCATYNVGTGIFYFRHYLGGASIVDGTRAVAILE